MFREGKAAADCGCYLASQLNDGIYPEDCLNVTSYLDHFKYQKAGFVAPPEQATLLKGCSTVVTIIPCLIELQSLSALICFASEAVAF